MEKFSHALTFISTGLLIACTNGVSGTDSATTGVGGSGGATGSVGGGGGTATSGYGEVRAIYNPTSTFVVAGFASEAPDYCTAQATEDTCIYYVCDLDQTEPTALDAGQISLSGGTQTAVLEFNPSTESYSLYDVPSAIFTPGQTLTLDVAGKTELPAITGTIEVPAVADLTSPSFADLSVDTSQPLAFTWTGGGTLGEVDVRLVTPDPVTDDAHAVLCLYPAADGMAVVSSAMLSNLPPTPDDGVVFISQSESVDLVEEGWTVALSVGAYVTSSSSANGYALANDIPIQ